MLKIKINKKTKKMGEMTMSKELNQADEQTKKEMELKAKKIAKMKELEQRRGIFSKRMLLLDLEEKPWQFEDKSGVSYKAHFDGGEVTIKHKISENIFNSSKSLILCDVDMIFKLVANKVGGFDVEILRLEEVV